MKYRIVYHLAQPLRERSREGAEAALASQSDDLDEFAINANGPVSASLQESEDGEHWKTLKTIS